MSIIEASNLTRIYGSGETSILALDHVQLSVGQGEFVAIMGPSGGGKSTLLNLLGGLDQSSEGEVVIDGQSLAELADDDLAKLRRQKIGYVFQFYNLIPVLTAVENAALPLSLDGVDQKTAHERALRWIEKIGLKDRANNRPDQLSGGQQQRVAIARALSAEPQLILADEPTGNLDSRSADEIAGLLKMVATEWGRAVVMVTHDAHIASFAGRLIFLVDGRVRLDARRPEKAEDGSAWVTDLVRKHT